MSNIAIFASGSGTNAANIIDRFRYRADICIKRIYCNKANAGALRIALKESIPTMLFDKTQLNDAENGVLKQLRDDKTDLIVLAGFLWLMPDIITESYPKRIINIHPALLPAYGGKGMYGLNVHKAVIDARETESGITIHYVNGRYDEGDIIFQAKCEVLDGDTPETLAKRIHDLEYRYFPDIILDVLNGLHR